MAAYTGESLAASGYVYRAARVLPLKSAALLYGVPGGASGKYVMWAYDTVAQAPVTWTSTGGPSSSPPSGHAVTGVQILSISSS